MRSPRSPVESSSGQARATIERLVLFVNMKPCIMVMALFALASCGDGKSDAAKQLAAQADREAVVNARDTIIDLAKYDLPLQLTVPDKQLTGGAEPEIVWKEETGRLEIKAGDHFAITITEETADIPRLKADLDRDLLKKNTVIKETPDLLEYKSEFPDDPSLMYIHFHRAINAGQRSFVVQDADNGVRFNQQDVERMIGAVAVEQLVP